MSLYKTKSFRKILLSKVSNLATIKLKDFFPRKLQNCYRNDYIIIYYI